MRIWAICWTLYEWGGVTLPPPLFIILAKRAMKPLFCMVLKGHMYFPKIHILLCMYDHGVMSTSSFLLIRRKPLLYMARLAILISSERKEIESWLPLNLRIRRLLENVFRGQILAQ